MSTTGLLALHLLSNSSTLFNIKRTPENVITQRDDNSIRKAIAPEVIPVEKNAAYPKSLGELKTEGSIPEACEL